MVNWLFYIKTSSQQPVPFKKKKKRRSSVCVHSIMPFITLHTWRLDSKISIQFCFHKCQTGCFLHQKGNNQRLLPVLTFRVRRVPLQGKKERKENVDRRGVGTWQNIPPLWGVVCLVINQYCKWQPGFALTGNSLYFTI